MNYMLSMLAIAGMLFLSSCGDDEEDPAPKGATVGLIATDSSVSGDVTLTVGSQFGILVSASKGDRNMDTWSILRDGVALTNFQDLDVPDADAFTVPVSGIDVPLTAGSYTYTFQVTSNGGATGSVSWVVTAEAPSSFTEFSGVELGGQTNPTFGSFYTASNGDVQLVSEAKPDGGATVDLFFYFGTTNGATLWSPQDNQALTADLFGSAGFGLSTWTTRKDTKLDRTTSLTYDSATPADVAAASVTGTKVTMLTNTDVILFETEEGLKGIIEILSVPADGSGTLTFNAKVID